MKVSPPTQTKSGRCAAYGGVCIAASPARLWIVEGQRPDRWDLTGAAICLVGVTIVLLGPRSAPN
ncbi:YnfA family protein [Azospirillum canadense]|uniref:hypothetical protein n=1 Tax=Azospirillum canadense TaxID=403962 RepID=UPI0029CABF68|nr:hypothetical protein [Azospirillum canadense]